MNELEQLIEDYGITADVTRIPKRADGLMGDNFIHWLMILKSSRTGREEVFNFSHGFGWTPDGKIQPRSFSDFSRMELIRKSLTEYGKQMLRDMPWTKPSPIDILPSLIIDTRLSEDYEDWAEWTFEFGYTDSVENLRRGKNSYEESRNNSLRLANLLGVEGYAKLMEWEEE